MDSIRCYKWGTIVPIPERYVIDEDEAALINNTVAGFNSVISFEAANRGLALADMNALFKNLEKGIIFNGVKLSSSYLKSSAFSTDGFYPNQRGYALIANEFLKSVNRVYLSNLPLVDVNSFQGIVFP
jgi:lysophospholipase L1-like esterase